MEDVQLTQTFEWRDRAVAWRRIGNGPPVVMCHGTPWSSELWAPFASALSRDFAVYLWDMPGYGQSSKHPEHAVDLGTQGELLADLLRHWELPSPHLVGHDYGGAVCLRAHLLHGSACSSMALIDVVALRPWGSDFFRLVAENPAVFAAQPPAIHKAAVEAYIRGASHRSLTTEQLERLTAPWESAEGQIAFYSQIAAADERYTEELEDSYALINFPVKIIWGERDSWIPPDRAARLLELIPHAELELIADAGHLIQLDAPAQLAVALQRWLTQLR